MRFWTGQQSLDSNSVCYEDSWATVNPQELGHTFSPQNPLAAIDVPHLRQGQRIDYILVRCERHGPTLSVSHCERIFHQPHNGVWASDHFGLTADFRILASK
jgi:hypothetical protein